MSFAPHDFLDVALGVGLAHFWWSKTFGGKPSQTPTASVTPAPAAQLELPFSDHNVQILKGDTHVGWRPAGHPDLAVALATKGLRLRWPDGRIQEEGTP